MLYVLIFLLKVELIDDSVTLIHINLTEIALHVPNVHYVLIQGWVHMHYCSFDLFYFLVNDWFQIELLNVDMGVIDVVYVVSEHIELIFCFINAHSFDDLSRRKFQPGNDLHLIGIDYENSITLFMTFTIWGCYEIKITYLKCEVVVMAVWWALGGPVEIKNAEHTQVVYVSLYDFNLLFILDAYDVFMVAFGNNYRLTQRKVIGELEILQVPYVYYLVHWSCFVFVFHFQEHIYFILNRIEVKVDHAHNFVL